MVSRTCSSSAVNVPPTRFAPTVTVKAFNLLSIYFSTVPVGNPPNVIVLMFLDGKDRNRARSKSVPRSSKAMVSVAAKFAFKRLGT